MAFIKNKYLWIVFGIFFIAIIIFVGGKELVSESTYTVKSGPFELALNIKGEVQGKNAVIISLPDELKRRDLRLYELKIKDMVEEGTEVKKGEWIATLDAATITQQMQENSQELTERRAEFNDAKIDSAIQLTRLREEIAEFKYDLEYNKLELEQAKYESPAYQRKKQVEFNNTLRQMEKKKRDYELNRINLKSRTRRAEEHYDYSLRRDSLYKQAITACRVTAPKEGMVMYAKLWGGRKLRIGDMISPWMPTIATLPDMSVLVSETYVPEIDITKIAEGDSVEIYIDALPNNLYSGRISKIANIGQELPGFDNKVFKVLIDMDQNSKEIKPAMTTDNKIILTKLENTLKIPRTCLFKENDEFFVYLKKEGEIIKQIVVPGAENEQEVV
ncbi:MAG TPA: HlyD family efflux transporter periplasmic adaptor subunit, partial [Draconibacterium sp.]|nr:HlyD family efflux transporter periplasmic adaptor subunit [Draconibacterium sp.]